MKDDEWIAGMKVSLAEWDKYEPPWKKFGDATVISTSTKQRCESGLMVTVRNAAGSELTLDSHWLRPMS